MAWKKEHGSWNWRVNFLTQTSEPAATEGTSRQYVTVCCVEKGLEKTPC